MRLEERARLVLASLAPSLRSPVVETPIWKSFPFAGGNFLEVGQHSFDIRQVQAAVDLATPGQPAPLRDAKGTAAVLRRVPDQFGLVLECGNVRARLPGFLLTSQDPRVRREHLDRVSNEVWLGPAESELRQATAAAPFNADQALAFASRLQGTPEAYLGKLEAIAAEGEGRALTDLEWADAGGLALLVGPAEKAVAIKQFEKTCATIRGKRLSQMGAAGIRILLSTSAHHGWALKPLPRAVGADDLINAAFPDGQLGDPFAILSALDAARRAGARVHRAIPELIERLKAEESNLARAFKVFSAGFVLSTVALGRGPATRDAPVAWRRAAAFMTAGMQTSVFARYPQQFADELHDAVFERYAFDYDTITALDAREAPRWQPHFGQFHALHGYWVGRLWRLAQDFKQHSDGAVVFGLADELAKRLGESDSALALLIPGPVGGRRQSELEDWIPSQEIEDRALPTTTHSPRDQWRGLANLTAIHAPSERMKAAAAQLVANAPAIELLNDEGQLMPEVTGVCHLLAFVRDADTAHVLQRKIFEATRQSDQPWSTSQAVLATLILGAVHEGDSEYAASLRDGFDRLATGVNNKASAALLSRMLESVVAVRPRLIPYLARAAASASAFARSI